MRLFWSKNYPSLIIQGILNNTYPPNHRVKTIYESDDFKEELNKTVFWGWYKKFTIGLNTQMKNRCNLWLCKDKQNGMIVMAILVVME
jgi:hypothetical protein